MSKDRKATFKKVINDIFIKKINWIIFKNKVKIGSRRLQLSQLNTV